MHGVSTRKVDDLVKAPGADSDISKSEVSRICCADLEEIAAFRDRQLVDWRSPTCSWTRTYCKARVNRRVLAIATGVAGDGHRRSRSTEGFAPPAGSQGKLLCPEGRHVGSPHASSSRRNARDARSHRLRSTGCPCSSRRSVDERPLQPARARRPRRCADTTQLRRCQAANGAAEGGLSRRC